MYKEFAYIYDKLTFDIDYEEYSEVIKRELKKLDIKPESILELGIGSGNMTKYFYNASINYTGVDLSKEMLKICADKFPNISIINEDLCQLELTKNYDFIFSTLDTINYILDSEKLQNLFSNINENCTGVFMFDVNTPYKLIEVMGNNHFVYEYEDIFYTWVNQYYEEDNLIDFYIDFFVKNQDNSYKRIRESQTEKVYSLDALRFMLYNSGFNTVKIIDFDTGKILNNCTQRALLICY
ncbi:class I SAM-dependent methyltransferase [Finegoldia magna]|uniref:class I SAM-dependent DNA methyltransferase n=2 Tax=Finegoldia magna TaxID=1260 RepID=UPI00288AE1D4|nr:class I SAM-dependent methyltransferase [Finegoldia magna]MDU5368438.1 class I SAM-dependent methyltransferase [Finegoldia magna]